MSEIRNFGSNAQGRPQQSMPCPLAAVVVGEVSGRAAATPIGGEETRDRMELIKRELIEPIIVQHRGRLVKTTSKGFVAIFDHPIEAARCGAGVQQRIVERNQSLTHPWIEHRIGVNLGDVITDPNDIYGDGICVASGLAAIAGPGQVCVSGGVYEQIKHKLLYYYYEPLGDRKIENSASPVTCYRMHSEPDALHKIGKRREIILIFLLCLSLLVIAGGIWYLFEQPNRKVAGADTPNRIQTVQRAFQTDELDGHPISFKDRSGDLVRVGN
jgi:class 3 adenylate cyclase